MVPLEKQRDAGATGHVGTLDGKDITGWAEKDWGKSAPADRKMADAFASDYGAIVLPGGQINPALLRVQPKAMNLLRAFFDAGKTVAMICHAPWFQIKAGVAKGCKLTSYATIRTDVENACGAGRTARW